VGGIKVKFTLELAFKAQKENSSLALRLFDLGVGWERVVKPTTRPLYHRERRGIPYVGGWVSPRAGLDGYGKSHLHRVPISGPCIP
jgi:hypothetical protein